MPYVRYMFLNKGKTMGRESTQRQERYTQQDVYKEREALFLSLLRKRAQEAIKEYKLFRRLMSDTVP